MTDQQYQQLPAFFRAFPKATLEAQYRKNAESLRVMQATAERTGRKCNGFTAAQLKAKAEEFEALSRCA